MLGHRIVVGALVVAELVRERVGPTVLGADAEPPRIGPGISNVLVRNAAHVVGVVGDEQRHQVCAVLVTPCVHLVHVCVFRCGQPVQIDPHVVLLAVLRLIAVHQANAGSDPAVGVEAVGVIHEQADEGVDVSRRSSGLRSVGDEHVHHFAGARFRQGLRRVRSAAALVTLLSDCCRDRFSALAHLRPEGLPRYPAPRQVVGVVAVDDGESVTERAHPVNLAIVPDRAEHVRAHHDQ